MPNHHTTPPPPRVVPPAVTEFLGVHDPQVARARAELKALSARLAAEARFRAVSTASEIPSPGLIPVPVLTRALVRQEEIQRKLRKIELEREKQRVRSIVQQLQVGIALQRVGPSFIPVPGVARAIAAAEVRRFTPPPRHP